jgi:hypothetical protein
MKYTITHEQEKLAVEIASTLGDMGAIGYHRKLVCTYSEDYLRKILQKVMSIKETDIRKSRGALYTMLVKQNGSFRD